MRELDDNKRTDATISTEKPLEKTDSGKTDKDGYIWVPEMHDSLTTTPPEVRPFKNKAELAQDL
jgi:sugar lactone lactonase YvrE